MDIFGNIGSWLWHIVSDPIVALAGTVIAKLLYDALAYFRNYVGKYRKRFDAIMVIVNNAINGFVDSSLTPEQIDKILKQMQHLINRYGERTWLGIGAILEALEALADKLRPKSMKDLQ